MDVRRLRFCLGVVFLVAAIASSPAALRGQSPGQRLDQELAALQAAIAALAQRVTALEPPPVVTPPAPPVPNPVPVPVPVPTTDPVSVTTAEGLVWTLAADGRVLANGTPFNNFGWGTVTEIRGTAFRQRGADTFLLMENGTWAAWIGVAWQATSVDDTGQPRAVAQAPAPASGGPVVVPPSGPPSPVQMFPLPDPLPQPPPVTNTNPQLLRVSDITPAIDPATGEPWYVDVSLDSLTADGGPVYDVLGYGTGFKVRRVDGDLRVVYAVGGDWNHPTTAREFSLAGLQPGRVNRVRFTNAWGDAFSGATFSPGEHLGLWIDPRNTNRILTCGSMDYVTHATATVFERVVGPNGAVSGLAAASFGRINKDDQGRLTTIDGLNGKECFGGFANTPLWMQRAYGMDPLMILGGQYTSLVAQAASASLGLFGATFKDLKTYLPQAEGAFVPVKVFADHKSGSRVDDWANPLDSRGAAKQTWAPGAQPFDRGRMIGGFIQNWLDGNVGVANASRSTLWKVDCDGTVCTTTEGPPWAPNDPGQPHMDMFNWWREGVDIVQHGVQKLIVPQSYVEVGRYEGFNFVGQKIPVKFVGGLDATHIKIDTDVGILKDAYFTGPNVEEFYRQVGFDDRNQWNGVFPDGAGRWSWGTGYEQTLTLIGNDEGTGKYGLIGIYNGALGQVFYDHSTFQADSRVFEWHIFDPTDFGKVAVGQLAPHMVQPAEMVLDRVLTDDGRRFGRTQGTLQWGEWASLALDAETGDLYVFGPLMAHEITGGQLRIRKYHCPACAAH